MLREKDLEVEGLAKGSSDGGVSGIMRMVFSASWDTFFTLRLLWGNKLFMDDLTLAEFGLGGSPALEAGLGTE